MKPTLSRRGLLVAAATLAVLPVDAATATAPRLVLPRPTGPHRIGTVSLHLVGPGRELMAGVWYPAGASVNPRVPWLPAAPWRALLDSADFGADTATAPLTAARLAAPVLRTRERLPVIMYSHGNDSTRAEATIIVQELASHGFVVVTVDTTYDGYGEFPDGRLTVPSEEIGYTPWDHSDDVRFVLDRIEDIAAGRNPDAGHRPLPAGLGAALDLRRVGMAGWSKGATATAVTMNVDRRVRAGLALDGPMQAQPPVDVIDRPFMLMTAENTRDAEPSVAEVWNHYLRGWKCDVRAEGAVHSSYIDHQWLIPQLARILHMSDEELAGWIGTLAPDRAVRIQQAYPLAFFDRHLCGRRQPLLDGPHKAFPEVRVDR
ncbi:lipase [Actinoplanes sichuanensis]|uniref:Alpha/beta hydrolase family protein n=1 Tax=Actinoplanes sichuanensis TaxID=512349 RepID=A0ABW4ANJ9_9ACTN|nr:acetylhydrolase [Actinoplanes sichuanensis]BEL06582.1 lipase [Actinoplanes sichuanensis]